MEKLHQTPLEIILIQKIKKYITMEISLHPLMDFFTHGSLIFIFF